MRGVLVILPFLVLAATIGGCDDVKPQEPEPVAERVALEPQDWDAIPPGEWIPPELRMELAWAA